MDANEQLQEEIFCLKFELDALSGFLLRGEAERWVPGFLYEKYEREHVSRYELVKTFVANKQVLDLACGSGYGSFILANDGKALHVDGGDINELSLRYARHRFHHPHLNYFKADAEQYSKPGQYDVIVSFETIEHLGRPELFLNNVSKSLAKDGLFFISTPLTAVTNKKPFNPYHTIEWSLADFQALIRKYFDIEEIYIQNVTISRPANHLIARAYRKFKTIIGGPIANIDNGQLIPYSKEWEGKTFYKGYQLLVCSRKK